MPTVDEWWVFFLILLLISIGPYWLKKIHYDYKLKAELSQKAVVFIYLIFGLFIMTILNAALYTRWVFAPDNFYCRSFGWGLISLGSIIIAEAFLEFHSFGRVSGMRADKVVSTGVYKFSRNPQYAAIFIFLIGFAIMHRSIIASLLIPIFITMVQMVIVPGEEKYLEKSLGHHYLAYKRKVKKWI